LKKVLALRRADTLLHMESSLLRATIQVAACGEGEAAWGIAVRRAARLLTQRWPTEDPSAVPTWSLQTLALFLYVLDRDERLDDPAVRAAVTPYVRTEGAEYLHTKDAAAATCELFAEHLPAYENAPLSRLIASLTTTPGSFEVPDLPAMWTPDFRMPLMLALEWLGYVGLQESTQPA
jgi:hypothetical protein